MRVKLFDENHERDLENSVNMFISTLKSDIIDIKYQVGVSIFGDEQIFCFSAMIIYEDE